MPNAAPKSRKWSAFLNVQPPGPHGLHISGEIDTGNSNQTPHLHERAQQVSDSLLMLELTVTTSGVGSTVLGHKTVEFRKKPSPDYTSVEIYSGGQRLQWIDVKRVH